ncbi:unannotated protein [freshwater metagenome]|uniref:Unannotated protein n=1 Tax=freshwater metagenome TaxID=449393 RepID=A0A6J7QYD1_9ZZZZ
MIWRTIEAINRRDTRGKPAEPVVRHHHGDDVVVSSHDRLGRLVIIEDEVGVAVDPIGDRLTLLVVQVGEVIYGP